jgi:hypothetical protein
MRHPIQVYFTILILAALAHGQDENHFNRSYPAKEAVHIKLASSDCFIEAGGPDKIVVDVRYTVTPADAFEPEVYESGSSLKISENWHGHSSGRVYWTITLPPATEVSFSAASGDLTVSGLNKEIKATAASGDIRAEDLTGDIEIKTASGDIRIGTCKGDIEVSAASGDIDATELSGEIEISAASGDVEIRDSAGLFDLGTASGDIKGTGLSIEGYSTFSAASGDVKIGLAASSKYDMELSAASGDVTLDYNGQPMNGYFELQARKYSGSITAPYPFDTEEEFERSGQTFEKKSFKRGDASPKITLQTSSGRAALKK